MKYTSQLFIIMITVIISCIVIFSLNNKYIFEKYQNLKNWSPSSAYGDNYLLKDVYPISNNPVSTRTYSQQWKNYPIFNIPSYTQMTNNLKYFKNPSIANSSPEDFLDTFYNNKTNLSNIVKPGEIKPIVTQGNPRIGYWNTKVDVLY